MAKKVKKNKAKPSLADAARTLIEVIKTEPKAVRRAMAKNNSAA
ncbi:MAG: hypothetical protein ABSD08_17270 [Xanthobacteraceae bacterium]|jgi:hypothetical protein